MALDRQAIEKKDFPISRRGYEPEAVDAHLASLADRVEDLERRLVAAEASGGAAVEARSRVTESLALAASEQVRVIVEAAESSAAEIEAAARKDADEIRSDARREAERVRSEAISRSQDHVGEVRESTSHMLQRVDAMENELGGLLEALRTGANRLTADLALVQGNMAELYGEATPAASAVGAGPAPARAAAPAAPAAADTEDEGHDAQSEAASALAAASSGEERAPEPEPEPGPAGGGDTDAARLVALGMALDGDSRETIDAVLADNFEVPDREALLDEVLASAGR